VSLIINVAESRLLEDIQSLLLIFCTTWILSPVLRTLTQPFSDDTILALSAALFFIHLFSQDYAYVSGLSKRYSAPISLNAAIFASVLLVSRLPSVPHVFAIISVAIELFALLPMLRRSVKMYSSTLNIVITILFCMVTFGVLVVVSYTLSLVYVLGILFISLICPYWLIEIQKYKNTIHGPWDEAVPTRNQPHWKL